jgi:hypothetical protein
MSASSGPQDISGNGGHANRPSNHELRIKEWSSLRFCNSYDLSLDGADVVCCLRRITSTKRIPKKSNFSSGSLQTPFPPPELPGFVGAASPPPSHTAWPVSRELPVDPYRDHRWDFPCCAWSPLRTCRRQPRQVGWNLFARTVPPISAFPETGAGRLLHHYFRGLLSVHSPYGLHALCTRGFSSLVASTAALIVTGWSEPVPGRVYPRCGPAPSRRHPGAIPKDAANDLRRAHYLRHLVLDGGAHDSPVTTGPPSFCHFA